MAVRERIASVSYGAATGSPLTILIAWVLNTYVLPEPMPVDVAAALGAVLGGIVLPMVQRVRQRRRERGERSQ